MRKKEVDKVLSILLTLKEAHKNTQELLSNNDKVQAAELLKVCQESALDVETYLDSLLGNSTKSAPLLAEYSEVVFRTYTQLENKGNESIAKLLDPCVDRICSCLRKELLEEKVEVVFFPYMASMWDSMESVWKAAKSDSKCEVYVVPIPYYDKLPNGQLAEMHYEGNQFPEGVEITDWMSYDFENRNPNIIFIHNPYDNFNYITSVHPRFYSSNLAKYTDLLAFIPYFFCGNNTINMSICNTEAMRNIDLCFVESGKMKNAYQNAVDMNFNRAGSNSIPAKRVRFVALGSPKLDKITSDYNSNYTLPDTWKKLMTKDDGSFRKVVLYNTSISNMLENSELYIKHLKETIALFEKEEDILLWWRPHPLMHDTFRAMRPSLYEEYSTIVNEFQSKRMGIYDTTSDLHRAIAVSDAYYGDWGSVLAMYQCTNKPIMTQNFHDQMDYKKLSKKQEEISKNYGVIECLRFFKNPKNGFIREHENVSLLDFMCYVKSIKNSKKSGENGMKSDGSSKKSDGNDKKNKGNSMKSGKKLDYANDHKTVGDKIYAYCKRFLLKGDGR
jgi:hypothetical protein